MIFPKTVWGISIEEEEKLSREFMAEINAHYEIINDSVITGYVTRIGEKILSVVPPQPFQYHFHVLKEDSFNAFAGPGGQIFIYSGLFEALESEDELAGIFGHEISHVVCRHISQQIEQSKKSNIGTLAGVAAGVLLGATGADAVAGTATAVGTLAAASSIGLVYSREHEMQADQRGVDFLTQAGFNPNGLLTALIKIRSRQWFGKDQVPTYMMTHPAVEDRIAYLSTWIEANASTVNSLPKRSNVSFDWVHTRLLGMFGPVDAITRLYQSDVNQNPDNALSQYGYGLVLVRSGNRKSAIDHLRLALVKRAFDPVILTDLGETYFLDGRYDESLKTIQGALDISPDLPEGLYYSGRSLIELGKYQEASRSLEYLVRTDPDFTDALYYLGNAYESQGNTADACYCLGKYYKFRGEYRNAVIQLQKAFELTTDPDKKSEIEALLKEIKKKQGVFGGESEKKKHP